jgi:predicted regulator of Ras-like GTPase activity (Roadblock/LC7/MglB family)
VRREIEQFQLAKACISIPYSRLEVGMKTGRVVFTWAEVCGWLAAPRPPSAHGESKVELPLRVVAPLFMAKHKAATPRKVVTVAESVPNLFAPGNRLVVPPAAPVPTKAPVSAPNVLGEVLGQPAKSDWTPEEIVQRILALPGIAGALLASNDGLLVAGRMPAPLKAETMAAFVPQMFTRISDCAREAQLGAVRGLRLFGGPSSCAIYQAGKFNLAALGKPGETLPEAALERIAGALAQQNH